MHSDNFKKNIELLSKHTGKKLSKTQLDYLYQQLKEISAPAMDSITSTFLTELKMQPSHFPTIGQFKKAWYAYRNAGKVSQSSEQLPCKFCNGRGVLRSNEFSEMYRGESAVMAFCAKCDNWRRYFNPAAIRSVSPDGVVISTFDHTRPELGGSKYFIRFIEPKPGIRGMPIREPRSTHPGGEPVPF